MRYFKIVLLLVLFCLGSCGTESSFRDLQGNTVKLKHFVGKWRVVNYWASWCPSCVKEIKELNAFHKQYQENGISVIGVNYDLLSKDKLKILVKKLNVKFPTLTNDPAKSLGIGHVQGLPMTFIIDNKGNIQHRLFGPQTRESIAKTIGIVTK